MPKIFAARLMLFLPLVLLLGILFLLYSFRKPYPKEIKIGDICGYTNTFIFEYPKGHGFELVVGMRTTNEYLDKINGHLKITNDQKIIYSNIFHGQQMKRCNWLENYGLCGYILPIDLSWYERKLFRPGEQYTVLIVFENYFPDKATLWMSYVEEKRLLFSLLRSLFSKAEKASGAGKRKMHHSGTQKVHHPLAC